MKLAIVIEKPSCSALALVLIYNVCDHCEPLSYFPKRSYLSCTDTITIVAYERNLLVRNLPGFKGNAEPGGIQFDSCYPGTPMVISATRAVDPNEYWFRR